MITGGPYEKSDLSRIPSNDVQNNPTVSSMALCDSHIYFNLVCISINFSNRFIQNSNHFYSQDSDLHAYSFITVSK